MRRIHFSFSLLLMIVPACFPQTEARTAPPTVTPQITSSIADARTLITQGRLQDAARELDVLAAQQPEPAGVERLRGFIAYQQNKMTEASEAFAAAVRQDPTDMESLQMRGVILFRTGQAAEAIPLLEKAHAAISSSNIDPNYVLALCYITTGRYDDARHAFAAEYGFPYDSAAAWLITARLLLRRELVQPAADAAQKALQADPHIPLAHQLLGEIALAKGDTAGAIAELEKEREINPLDGELYERLGDAYLRNGRGADAQQALDRAILLEPNSTGPYILLGKALLYQQNPVMATMYLERARAMDPANAMTHMLLGQAYRTTGRREDAAHEFETAAKLKNPGTKTQASSSDSQQRP
ncbi:tetratricopeptide repeat protein [Acidipila sp. 4G-K13]|uniref:Uncharacterized protein n=2 Tax=Paracidobacterium acidisoli TaxID=2303751 RepID=A0A372INS9_9BACT|nr:tetratricopeptide repeat protein [Paracidobacterium acidisoli]